MRDPLSLVTVIDLFTGVNELELEVNSISGDLLVGVHVDCADDRVVAIEGARFSFKDDCHGDSLHLRFSCSHSVCVCCFVGIF